jgi:hypothetical protein
MPMRIDVLQCEDPSCGGVVFRASPPADAATYGARRSEGFCKCVRCLDEFTEVTISLRP